MSSFRHHYNNYASYNHNNVTNDQNFSSNGSFQLEKVDLKLDSNSEDHHTSDFEFSNDQTSTLGDKKGTEVWIRVSFLEQS